MRNLIILFTIIISVGCGNTSKHNDLETKDTTAINEPNLEKSASAVGTSDQVPEGRCDINTVIYTRERIDSLTSLDVYRFLYTFSEDCNNNAEFTAVSNEVLFKVLLKHPGTLSENLNKDSINRRVLLEEMANPVVELESIDDVVDAVGILQIPDTLKRDLIKKLKDSI